MCLAAKADCYMQCSQQSIVDKICFKEIFKDSGALRMAYIYIYKGVVYIIN